MASVRSIFSSDHELQCLLLEERQQDGESLREEQQSCLEKLPYDVFSEHVLIFLTKTDIGHFANASKSCNELVAFEEINQFIKMGGSKIYPISRSLTICQERNLLRTLLHQDLGFANGLMSSKFGQLGNGYDWSCYKFQLCSPDALPLARGLQQIVDVSKDGKFLEPDPCCSRPLCRDRICGNPISLRLIGLNSYICGVFGTLAGWFTSCCILGSPCCSCAVTPMVVGVIGGCACPSIYAGLCGTRDNQFHDSLERIAKVAVSNIPHRELILGNFRVHSANWYLPIEKTRASALKVSCL